MMGPRAGRATSNWIHWIPWCLWPLVTNGAWGHQTNCTFSANSGSCMASQISWRTVRIMVKPRVVGGLDPLVRGWVTVSHSLFPARVWDSPDNRTVIPHNRCISCGAGDTDNIDSLETFGAGSRAEKQTAKSPRVHGLKAARPPRGGSRHLFGLSSG